MEEKQAKKEMRKHTLRFSPAKVGRAGEDVALQIEAAIIGGQIAPGEGLPSERELQNQFCTGRGVIREALRALKQKGLIEIRKGARGGAYVKQIEVGQVSESLALFLKQNHISPEHLIEFRESIDRTITTLAIARATPEEKADLVEGAAHLRQFLELDEPDMDALSEMDRELNIRLARMAGNPIFEWVMQAIQLGFSSNDYALYQDRDYREKTIANWNATASEIADNEPLRALSFISNHYVLLQRCVREQAKAQKSTENPIDEAQK